MYDLIGEWREKLLSASIRAGLLYERLRHGVAYNPVSERMTRDPYPEYSRLRSKSPAHPSRLINARLFSRYAHVDAILREPRRFSSDPAKGGSSGNGQPASRDNHTMLISDPPDHTRLRALVNQKFSRKKIDALASRIRAIMKTLLDDIADPAGFDLMKAVANPLPVLVIADMLGISADNRDWLIRWSNRGLRLLEPAGGPQDQAAITALDEYFQALIERGCTGADNIASALARAERERAELSRREMLNMLQLLFITGNETTANLIGNGMLALLRHPNELERLRDDPTLSPLAVEELLRFESPVQTAFRFAAADCDLDGHSMRQGEKIVLLIGAANRDPEVFQDPDRLDILRPRNSHLAFGRGIHHCLGATLARLEGRIAIEMLLQRFGSINLLEERPQYHTGVVLRGLKSLKVGAV